MRQPGIDTLAIEGYGSSLQVRQGAAFVLNVTGQRLDTLSAASLGTLPATILNQTETEVSLELSLPHGHSLGFLPLSLTTRDGTATRSDAVEVTEIAAAKSDKFKPDDSNPGTKERPFLTLSKALSVAAAGDTVLLGVGTYEEGETWPVNTGTYPPVITPNVPDGVTVVGQARDLVVLQGPGPTSKTSALVFAANASVRNLTVREFDRALLHVFADPNEQGHLGNITLENLELAENHEGLHALGAATVEIKNCTFLFNGASASGSGITLIDFIDAAMQNTTFTGNTYGVWGSTGRSVFLSDVTAQQSELDGLHLANIYDVQITRLRTLGNKRDGIYALDAGEASFKLVYSDVSGNGRNGVVIAGGAYATWDLGGYTSGGGNNTLANNGQWQLLDDRDANTGVTVSAEGNILGGFAVTPGTYTSTSGFGLEQTVNGVRLWKISRVGNSVAF